MKNIVLILWGFFLSSSFLSQTKKQVITPDAYAKWKHIEAPQISSTGAIISYVPTPQKGDQQLIIENTTSNIKRIIERGTKAKVAANEKWIAFNIQNYYDSIRSLKIKKTPKKKWPKDTLGIYLPQKDSLIYFSKVQSYKTAKEVNGNWIGILRTKSFIHTKKRKKKRRKKGPKEMGHTLTIYNPLTGVQKHISNIDSYTINDNGDTFFWTKKCCFNDTIDSTYIYQFNTTNFSEKLISRQKGTIKKLVSSKDAAQLCYLFSADTTTEKAYELYYWNIELNKTTAIAAMQTDWLSNNQSISEHYSPYFSENGNYLYFKVGKRPKVKQKDTIAPYEKYHLDLWSWTDNRLQSQQLIHLKKDQKKADLFVFHTTTKKTIRITDSTLKINQQSKFHNEQYLLASSQTPYLKEMTWDGWYYDYYRIAVETGDKERLLIHQNDQVKLSPSGKAITYYSQQDSAWYYQSITDKTTKKITREKYFHNQYHDVPGSAGSSGAVHWTKDEKFVLIKGQYDYWLISIDNLVTKRLTYGRERQTVYRYWKTNKEEERFIDLAHPIYFRTYNEKTKKEGVSQLKQGEIHQLFNHDKRIIFLEKAKLNEQVIMRASSFTSYPDLTLTNLSFNHFTKISDVNPQQKDYKWGTVELVSWKSYHNSDSLSGLLYKPEGFDSTQSYPMIVYFYERNSHNLHRYYAPRPTASIVYPTEYVSNDYLIFIPDVVYEIGEPAQGAYDCIVSGTEALVKKHSYIDDQRIGLQGQSWGGYQTAQLITMTNRYKCAMAGAPVSNMFSAYGGIRWASGLNRAFQYEMGQSRIGQTIWEAPDLYIKNSPLFHLPKVSTPLLIMHNDGDGAVPWYQGIELFNGLRRLQKPVWMLNYNDDAHNLKRRANKVDLSIRMKAFFDYYLQEKEAPEWMKTGRKALLKTEENYHPY